MLYEVITVLREREYLFPQLWRKMWITLRVIWRNPYDTHLLRRRKRKNHGSDRADLPSCRHGRQGGARAVSQKPTNGRARELENPRRADLSQRAAARVLPQHERRDQEIRTRDAR